MTDIDRVRDLIISLSRSWHPSREQVQRIVDAVRGSCANCTAPDGTLIPHRSCSACMRDQRDDYNPATGLPDARAPDASAVTEEAVEAVEAAARAIASLGFARAVTDEEWQAQDHQTIYHYRRQAYAALTALPHLTAAMGHTCPECAARDAYDAAARRDHLALVRALDVALNGEEGAAKQASLCDIVTQVRHGDWKLVKREDVAAKDAEIERLNALLEVRDMFIVGIGQWDAFVASLPAVRVSLEPKP